WLKSPLFLFVFISFGLCFSCKTSSKAGNEYLYHFDSEVSVIIGQPEKIRELQKREWIKYQQSGDILYLLSSKYAELFLFYDKRKVPLEQVPITFELLKLNNEKYDYITIACNFNLAFQLETVSPGQSFQFLDNAISLDEQS